MNRFLPGSAGSDHRVEDGRQLAHAGNDGKLLGFAGDDEAVVGLPDDAIEPDGGARPHARSTRAVHSAASAATVWLGQIPVGGLHLLVEATVLVGRLLQRKSLAQMAP